MSTDEVLWECFRHFAHLDHSNAAIHCGQVRYSPLTFRVAEALQGRSVDDAAPEGDVTLLAAVLGHRGQYPEDRGR